ncbi:hypothetical protein CR513_30595, partial [Mucuna pruriens]
MVPPRDETPTKKAIADVANEGKNVATPNQVNVIFAQRLKDEKKDKEFTSIPFIEAITLMLNYAEFLENIMSNKKKLEEFEVVNLTEECSTVVLKKLPLKLKDPSCFNIPCTMDNSHFEKALTITHQCDIVEDILVKVGKFIFLIDFVILNIEKDDTVPIILADHFLPQEG